MDPKEKHTATIQTRERILVRTFRGKVVSLTQPTNNLPGAGFREVRLDRLFC